MSNWDLIFEEMEATQPAFGVSIRAALYCLHSAVSYQFYLPVFCFDSFVPFFLWVFPYQKQRNMNMGNGHHWGKEPEVVEEKIIGKKINLRREKNSQEAAPYIRARFQSWDLWVMGPPRFRCATLICGYKLPVLHTHTNASSAMRFKTIFQLYISFTIILWLTFLRNNYYR